MRSEKLWKYCSKENCRDLLISFRLFGQSSWSDEKQIATLYILSNDTENHYSPTTIPKRDGTLRSLWIPDKVLKKVQKNILHNILDDLPISVHATAYRKGACIAANAAMHVGKSQILKLDIENFFGTISFPMIYQRAFPGFYFPPPVRTLLTSLCCHQDCLPQGAPTSAAISNLVMKSFDDYMGQWCSERYITYSRYCDDMTFSGEFNANLVKHKVTRFLHAMGFQLNEKKTTLLNQHHQQMVTDIVVNTKVQVSSQYRKTLRQDIYYCKQYGVVSHLMKIKDQNYLPFGQDGIMRYLSALLGKINFVLYVNPDDRDFNAAKIIINALIKKTKNDKSN